MSNPTNHEIDAAPRTVGQRLREAREALGLTLRDVAATTRIQASSLEYLEADRFDEFPAEVYCRGFLKNYARELRLDADALLAQWSEQIGRGDDAPVVVVETVDAEERTDASRFADRSRAGRLAYAAGLAMLVLGLALSVLIFGGGDSSSASAVHYDAGDATDAWRPAPEGQDDWRTYREN